MMEKANQEKWHLHGQDDFDVTVISSPECDGSSDECHGTYVSKKSADEDLLYALQESLSAHEDEVAKLRRRIIEIKNRS